MKKTLFACAIFLSLVSCKKFISISKNEDKGIKQVLEFFGGYCEYSIGATYSSGEGTKKYFELKLSKSEVVDSYEKTPEASTSNAAYRFYTSLNEEAQNYDEIHVILLFKDGTNFKAIYTRPKLALVQHKMAIIDHVVSLIKNKKFDEIKPLLSDSAYTDADKNQLITNIKSIDPPFGNITGFQLFGFHPQTIKNYELIEIFGIMLRDKQNNQFLIKVDQRPTENKVMYLDYKFPFEVK